MDDQIKSRVKAALELLPDGDVLLPEDEAALKEAENDIKNGNVYTHDEVWG